MQVTTIGLDLAKHVFQIHGIDAAEKVVVRRQLRRSQVMKFFEALATFESWNAASTT
jgi:transposase